MSKQTKETQVLDPNIIRQGDVCLVRVGDVTEEEIPPSKTDVILKYGEVTFHKHRFMAESRVSFLGRNAEQLAVGAPSALRHEEHAPATVPPGLYDLPDQVEHTDEDEPRVVAD